MLKIPRRIFIVGCNGQLAQALGHECTLRGHLSRREGRSGMDITDRKAVAAAIADFAPDVVVNAAAYTDVDMAENEPEQAFLINRDGAVHVAAAAASVRAPLIHISTDYVFDGSKLSPYVESDQPNPMGVYGASKLAGEAEIASVTGDHVILRTSWLSGPHGSNFVKTILRLASERDEIGVVDDQWGTPTFAADLANAIVSIGEKLLTFPDRSPLWGLYHAAGSAKTTWCRFAREIIARSSVKGGPSCFIRAITSQEYRTNAKRPANSQLDCSRLADVFKIRLPAWQESLTTCLDQLIAEKHE